MKIRQGFVSNSSSSSFCLYGITMDEWDMKEALIKQGIATEEELSDGLYEYLDDWSFKYDLKQKGLSEEEIAVKLAERPLSDFEYESINGEYHYIGISWRNIKDDETGAEFKARIDKKMTEVFGEDAKCSTYEEAWYPC